MKTIEVVYVKGNPYPYILHKSAKLLDGSFVNATSLNKGTQYCVFIDNEEIIKRENIQIEDWM